MTGVGGVFSPGHTLILTLQQLSKMNSNTLLVYSKLLKTGFLSTQAYADMKTTWNAVLLSNNSIEITSPGFLIVLNFFFILACNCSTYVWTSLICLHSFSRRHILSVATGGILHT